MREKVIIFDGEKDQVIGAPYFFQDERIRDLNKEQVLEIYKGTRVKLHVAKEYEEVFDEMKLTYIHQMQRGLDILKIMVKDMYGDDIGEVLINQVETNLKQVS